jgi:ATP-dependent DNA ligase
MIANFPLPVDTAPMEARLADDIPTHGNGWQYEPKWDGFRCIAFKSGDLVDIRAKSGKPLGRYFPEIVELLADLDASQFVVDGEIVIEVAGHYSFDALQMRLHPAESRIRKLASQTPAKLILFDMLADIGGNDLRGEPLSVRRAVLEQFVKSAKSKEIELSAVTLDAEEASKWLTAQDAEQTDGIVAKRRDQQYLSGERAMVKVKPVRSADCVVGGFMYLANKQQVGSLLLGLYNDEGKLDHVGFTATIRNEQRTALNDLRSYDNIRGSQAMPQAVPVAGVRNAVPNGSRCGRSLSSRYASIK